MCVLKAKEKSNKYELLRIEEKRKEWKGERKQASDRQERIVLVSSVAEGDQKSITNKRWQRKLMPSFILQLAQSYANTVTIVSYILTPVLYFPSI